MQRHGFFCVRILEFVEIFHTAGKQKILDCMIFQNACDDFFYNNICLYVLLLDLYLSLWMEVLELVFE